MSEIRVDRIVDSTGNSPVIYLDPSVNEVRIGTGITFNTITNQIILGDTVVGDISGNANFSGIVTASSFVGDGSGLTNLPVFSDFVRTDAGIHTLGNVGVGTTNPQVRLQIGGVLGFEVYDRTQEGSSTNPDLVIGTNILIGDNTTGPNLDFGSTDYEGMNNIFIGVGAGSSATTVYGNHFIGKFAGRYTTTGSSNNFFGRSSGRNNTTGFSNNFFGLSSGHDNTTGTFNAFFGTDTGYYNTIGESNSFTGGAAGFYNTSGCYNSFFGSGAGLYNQTGSFNTFLGSYNGISTSSSYKILIGSGGSWGNNFDSPDTTKDTQLAIGIRTSSEPSNYWIVGDENFNIGIGITNPSEKLSVGGNISLNQTTIYGSVQASTASTIATGIHSGLSTSVYRSVEYTIQASQGSNHQAIKILAIHDGTTAYDTQYGNIYNTEVATFDVDISGGNVRLVAVASSTSTTNYTVNFIATKI